RLRSGRTVRGSTAGKANGETTIVRPELVEGRPPPKRPASIEESGAGGTTGHSRAARNAPGGQRGRTCSAASLRAQLRQRQLGRCARHFTHETRHEIARQAGAQGRLEQAGARGRG